MVLGCAARSQPDASGGLQLGCLQGCLHTARCKQFPAPGGCSGTGLLALLSLAGEKVHGGWASRMVLGEADARVCGSSCWCMGTGHHLFLIIQCGVVGLLKMWPVHWDVACWDRLCRCVWCCWLN